MNLLATLQGQLHIRRRFAVQFLSIMVASHGLFILATTLLEQLAAHHNTRLSDITVDIPLLIGLGLVYLAMLLLRNKRTAWLVTVLAYMFYLALGVSQLLAIDRHQWGLHEWVRVLVLPLLILGLLFRFQGEFVVKSDIQGFRWAARFSLLILLAAFIYGVAGFSLLDESDFHQEISPPTAAHYTIDQFDLTTNRPVRPYTKRAHLFVDSLSFVSLAALGYAALSLFQPLRFRLSDQRQERELMRELLGRYGGHSEDYFKLWPDKHYFFDEDRRSGLAFHVQRGVALCLGDPVGQTSHFPRLLTDFAELCYGNDWAVALIHVQETHRRLYEKQGFSLQKIGQEAVLDLAHFQKDVVSNKYFRHIRNKFTKQGFSCELLQPPHHEAVLGRLQTISKQWLAQPGRVERGFVMGYYTAGYMQQCPIMVVRDAAGTIQAFVSLVPAEFDTVEATFDMLRHTNDSPGNINDFLLMALIGHLQAGGYERLNLGLCPLVGLDEPDEEKKGLIDGFLRFAYANGDRFYSFSGLHRFKAKYEPEWRDRYVVYQDGLRGFSRTMTALMRTMRVGGRNH